MTSTLLRLHLYRAEAEAVGPVTRSIPCGIPAATQFINQIQKPMPILFEILFAAISILIRRL